MSCLDLSAREVLDRILELNENESGDDSANESVDENQDAIQDEPAVTHDDSLSDSSDDEELAANDVPTPVGRDGTPWIRINRQDRTAGRVEQHNVFTARTGLTRFATAIQTPLDAFKLLLDDQLLEHIREFTMAHARTTKPNFELKVEELHKFIGLLYLRGIMHQRNYPLEHLWSTTMGCPAFNRTMPRDRMRAIKQFIRFDVRQDRRANLATDKFALISVVLKKLVDNSQRCFRPGVSFTIDEQLFPTKARCPFTHSYMPKKPDKFGIKFWVLADVETKYCFNIIPYIGRDEQRVLPLGYHVVLKLLEPLHGFGYNVTTDNFFTSKALALDLLQHHITITGTVRGNCRELPPPRNLALYESDFFQCDQLHLTRYQAKSKKVVHILRTQHKGSKTRQKASENRTLFCIITGINLV